MNKDLGGNSLWNERNRPNTRLNSDKAVQFDYIFRKYSNLFLNKNFLEIGAIPGNFCVFFNKNFNCRIAGLDYGKKSIFENTMEQYGIDNYEFIDADFLEFQPIKMYDIVFSHGFIEHFLDTGDILQRHIELANPDGIVIIAVPNFKKLQFLFHYIFDYENLKIHNTGNAMNKNFIEKFFKDNSLQILYSGYSKDSRFWADKPKNRLRYPFYFSGLFLAKILNICFSHFSSPYTSTYLLIIAKKSN